MIQLAVVAAVAAVVGGVIAIAARDGRLVALGLVMAMIAAPLASAPEPPALTIAFWILGALLAGYLLWIATPARSVSSEGSGIGPVAEVAAAAAAFCIGWLIVPVKPLAGPVAAQAAGVSLVALAIAPLTGRNVLRVGTGFAVLALGLSLLLEAWVGLASPLLEIVVMALLIGIVGATSLLLSPTEPPSPLPEDTTGAEALAGSVETAQQSAVESSDESAEEVGPKRDGRPATGPAATSATSSAAPEAAVETAPEPAPETAPEPAPEAALKRVPTVRAAGPRSPRAIRHGAPTRGAKGPAPVEEAAPVDGPAPAGEEASNDEASPAPPASRPPAAPAPARTRRLRPREPRP
jgi:hypothetical protein